MVGEYPQIYLAGMNSNSGTIEVPQQIYHGISLRFLYRAFGARPAFADDEPRSRDKTLGTAQMNQNFGRTITDLILISNEDEQRIVAIMPPNYAVVSMKFSGSTNSRQGAIFGNKLNRRSAPDLKGIQNDSLHFCVYVPILQAPNVSILFCKMLGNSFCDWLLVKIKDAGSTQDGTAYFGENKKIFSSLMMEYEDLLSKAKIVVRFRWGLQRCTVDLILAECLAPESKQLAIGELDEHLAEIFTLNKIGVLGSDGKFFRKSTRFNMTLAKDSDMRLFESMRYDDAMHLIELMPYLDQFETIERSSAVSAVNTMLICYQGVKLSQIEQRLQCLKTRVLKMVKSSTLPENFKYYLIWTVSLGYFKKNFNELTAKPAVVLICCDDQKKKQKMTNKDWKSLSYFLEHSRTAIVVLDINFESISAIKMILEEFARCFGLKLHYPY